MDTIVAVMRNPGRNSQSQLAAARLLLEAAFLPVYRAPALTAENAGQVEVLTEEAAVAAARRLRAQELLDRGMLGSRPARVVELHGANGNGRRSA